MSPNSSAVLGSVPRPRVGTASGTLAQMRVTGQALGIALSAAIVATRLPVHLAELGGPPTAALQSVALAGAIHDAFVVAGPRLLHRDRDQPGARSSRPGAADAMIPAPAFVAVEQERPWSRTTPGHRSRAYRRVRRAAQRPAGGGPAHVRPRDGAAGLRHAGTARRWPRRRSLGVPSTWPPPSGW